MEAAGAAPASQGEPLSPKGCTNFKLRQLTRLVSNHCETHFAETGLKMEQLTDLIDRMKKAKFGVLFFGMGLSMTRGKHMNSAALLHLAAEMNAFTKFVAMPMRGHGNVTGAEVIMRSQTGYPFGISFNRGYPRYNPGEYSAEQMLERGDVDACLLVGSEGVSQITTSVSSPLRSVSRWPRPFNSARSLSIGSMTPSCS